MASQVPETPFCFALSARIPVPQAHKAMDEALTVRAAMDVLTVIGSLSVGCSEFRIFVSLCEKGPCPAWPELHAYLPPGCKRATMMPAIKTWMKLHEA